MNINYIAYLGVRLRRLPLRYRSPQLFNFLGSASEIKEVIFLDTEVPIPHTMVPRTIVAIFLRLTRRGSYYCRLHNPLLFGSCFLNGYKKKNMFYVVLTHYSMLTHFVCYSVLRQRFVA